MKLTKSAKISDFQGKRQWFIIDAEGVVLGKLATKIANMLRGKDKPEFTAHVDCGDHIIVINADKVVLTGNKLEGKMYRRHSGYLGNLKETNAKKVLERQPKRVLEEAVHGMLPKNKLRKIFMAKLHLYAGAEHKHAGQNPVAITL